MGASRRRGDAAVIGETIRISMPLAQWLLTMAGGVLVGFVISVKMRRQ